MIKSVKFLLFSLTILINLNVCVLAADIPNNGQTNISEKTVERIVYVTRTGKRYHRANCRYLKSVSPMEIKEAQSSGYTPCKVCQPN
jgi:hypothetical protein